MRLEHADRQHDRLQPGELQPPLDRERRLVVEQAVVEPVVLEDELAEKEDRARELLPHLLAELDDRLDRLGADLEAVVGLEAELVREVHVLLEVLDRVLLERLDLGVSLEDGRVDDADRDEEVALVLVREERSGPRAPCGRRVPRSR